MPEGPEVETVRRELLPLINQKIKKISLTPLSQKYSKYQGEETRFNQFSGVVLTNIYRFGKFLVWVFQDSIEPVILNHLGMSGKWCLVSNKEDYLNYVTHPKVIIETEGPYVAVFDDIRNFGQFRIFPSFDVLKKYPPIKSLGIDGLQDPFPLEEFLEKLALSRHHEKVIGELLLDQKLVAGVGNIYKSESLYLARIHPSRVVKTLQEEDRRRLGESISIILHKALSDGGSTINNTPYSRPSRVEGEAQYWHSVYKREGQECKQCSTPIERIIQKERSTYYCPKCQEF